MINSKHINNILISTLIFVCLFWASKSVQTFQPPPLFISKQDSSINLNKNIWKYFHLGQKRLISSLYWTATIIESDIQHYNQKDLNSWMFLRFDTIAMLEPKFLTNYTFGGPYLSIVKDDLEGASILYKKGIEQYPNNVSLLKNAAFHFFYEARDFKEAKSVYLRIRKIPNINPAFLNALARIESNQGNLDQAFLIIKDVYDNFKSKKNPLSEILHDQLYAIRAEIDLKCLNEKQSVCNKIDFNGNKYIKKNDNTFIAVESWIPFRIKNRKNN